MEQSDSLQKTIRQVATGDCYPPIEYQVEAFIPEGKTILAVIVGQVRKGLILRASLRPNRF